MAGGWLEAIGVCAQETYMVRFILGEITPAVKWQQNIRIQGNPLQTEIQIVLTIRNLRNGQIQGVF